MKKIRISIFTIALLIFMTAVVYAAPSEDTKKEVIEPKIINLEYRETKAEEDSEETVDKEGLYSEGTLLFEKDSLEMQTFLDSIKVSAKEDAINGLSKIVETIPTRDNVELQQWGLFLYKYTAKEVTEYPLGDITFKLGVDTYNIKASKAAKVWVKDFVLPIIYEGIISENQNYPASMYKLNIEAGKKLTELTFDMKDSKNFEEFYTVFPFTCKDENKPIDYIIYNTGTYYGLAMDSKYVEVLKGFHNESDYLKGINADVPSCVSILAYITLPKDLTDLTIEGKSLQDMAIYKGLAVNLIDKKLIDTNNLTTDNVELVYKDYSLKEEELILISLTDSVVVVQPIFVEYFNKWGKELNTAHYVDFTSFLIGEGTEVQMTDMSDGSIFNSDIANYVEDDGLMSLRLGGRYPFGVFVRDDSLPFDRVLKRLYGPEGATVVTESELETITDSIEKDLKSQGRSADFKVYMEEAGASSFPFIVIPIFLVLVGCVFIVIRMSIKKKKRNNLEDNSDLLFNPDDEEDNN